eukprot:10541_4
MPAGMPPNGKPPGIPVCICVLCRVWRGLFGTGSRQTYLFFRTYDLCSHVCFYFLFSFFHSKGLLPDIPGPP